MEQIIADKSFNQCIRSIYGIIHFLNYYSTKSDTQGDRDVVVIKQYKDASCSDRLIENVIMCNLKGAPYVTIPYDCFYCPNLGGSHYLVLPYYSHQLSAIGSSIEHVRISLYQLLVFADTLAAQGIIHRDLKPNNILIDSHGDLRVIDFGLACYQQEKLRSNLATLWYCSPEMLNKKEDYTTKSDLWSIGCLICQQILDGQPLFDGNTAEKMLDKIQQFDKFKRRFQFEIAESTRGGRSIDDYQPHWPMLRLLLRLYKASSDLFPVLMGLLEVEPRKRPSTRQLLKNPVFPQSNVPLVSSPEGTPSKTWPQTSYHCKIPILNIDTIRLHPTSISSPPEPIMRIPYQYPVMRDNLSIGISIDKWPSNSLITDVSTSVQAMYLYRRVQLLLSQSENLPLLWQLRTLLGTALTVYLNPCLFDVCVGLMWELTHDAPKDPYPVYYWGRQLTLAEVESVRQIIIDLTHSYIKQDRRLYHSACNHSCALIINAVYDLLYLLDPSVMVHYTYNYVFLSLRHFKYGQAHIIDPPLCQLFTQTIEQRWKSIQNRLIARVDITSESLATLLARYCRYCKHVRSHHNKRRKLTANMNMNMHMNT